MKGQDLLLLLKLVSLARAEGRPLAAAAPEPRSSALAEQAPEYAGDPYAVRSLAESSGISKSEVSDALRRCTDIGLLSTDRQTGKPRVNTRELYELLAHGIRYFFPARPGPLVRGLPTAHAAPVLAERLLSAGEHIHVWEDAGGDRLGQRIEPLFRSVPQAVRRDPDLYAMLALVDSIRLGRAREAGLARELLQTYLRDEVTA